MSINYTATISINYTTQRRSKPVSVCQRRNIHKHQNTHMASYIMHYIAHAPKKINNTEIINVVSPPTDAQLDSLKNKFKIVLKLALKSSYHWGDPGVDGRIILGWIFGKWDVGVWTGWNWLRIGTGGVRL